MDTIILTSINLCSPHGCAVAQIPAPNKATGLFSAGLAFDSAHDAQQALQSYNQSLALWRAVGDRAGEAATLNNIAEVYLALALDYYKQARLLTRAAGDNRDSQQTVTVDGGRTSRVAPNLLPDGKIIILTVPPGVEIFIDGRSFGPSPVAATLPAGQHTYEIRLPGKPPSKNTFTMTNGAIIMKKVTFGGAAGAGQVGTMQ
jgi:tetratricopeptide (TPR) repeat protein